MTREKILAQRTDQELFASAAGTADYTKCAAAIASEMPHGGLPEHPPISGASVSATSSQKSVVAAVLLALFFGPLGMLYIRRFWRAFAVNAAGHLLFVAAATASGETEVAEAVIGGAYLLFGLVFFPVWAALRARSINRMEE